MVCDDYLIEWIYSQQCLLGFGYNLLFIFQCFGDIRKSDKKNFLVCSRNGSCFWRVMQRVNGRRLFFDNIYNLISYFGICCESKGIIEFGYF